MRLRDALPVVGLLRQRRVLERLRGADGRGRGQTGGVHAVQLGAESGNAGFFKAAIYTVYPDQCDHTFFRQVAKFRVKNSNLLNKKVEKVAILAIFTK